MCKLNIKRVDFDNNQRNDSVYSLKMKAGKRRTYFFDVRKTKGEDYYLTLTESTKKMNGDGYERHKLFLYKEDFHRFLSHLQEAIDHVKNDLLPEYDYDEFNRPYDEYYEGPEGEIPAQAPHSPTPPPPSTEATEDDMTW